MAKKPLDRSDPIAVLLVVASAFDAWGVPHAVYGGLALAAWGEARETRDVDLAVADAFATTGQAALAKAGLPSAIVLDRVPMGGLCVTRLALLGGEGAAGLHTVDMVEPRSERFAREASARALSGVLRGVPVRILQPEDFVLFKLLSTRQRDLEDALSVLSALAERLDATWLEGEVTRLSDEIRDHDVVGRFRQVRADSPTLKRT